MLKFDRLDRRISNWFARKVASTTSKQPKLRILSVRVDNDGFFAGLQDGMVATNHVFGIPLKHGMVKPYSGMEADVKALRSDVRAAKSRFAHETATSANKP